MQEITIVGGGPSGAAAAIAALLDEAAVQVVEQSSRRKHRVCGEFLSPQIGQILTKLGVSDEFQRRQPARIRSCRLHFGRTTKSWGLAEPGFGLSRYELDDLLLQHATSLGARVIRSHRMQLPASPQQPLIWAAGRQSQPASENRLFGFKAHFQGPTDDSVELFFFSSGYVGVSSVEKGLTNVCGIAPECALRAFDFDLDEFVVREKPLAERLRPLQRSFPWLVVGPLAFRNRRFEWPNPQVYFAGDSLGFLDPFTGSGLLNALLTGTLAGTCAARGIPSQVYRRDCWERLKRPYRMSGWIRAALSTSAAPALAQLIPGNGLFRMTRVRDLDVRSIHNFSNPLQLQ